MFRIIESVPQLDGDMRLITAYCKSGDTKKVGNFATGSFCMEIDTGKVFLYDEEGASGSEWIEQDFDEDGEET